MQRSATLPPEPPNGNSRGPPASPRRLPGGEHWAQGSRSLPLRTSAASPPHPGCTFPAAPTSGEERRRGRLRRRSHRLPGSTLPHTPPTPAPEAAARDPAGRSGARRARQSYSLGKRSCPRRAAAPGAAAQRHLRSPRPAEGARSEAASAPPGIAAAAVDFLARSKLWPRLHFSTAPAAFPGASARAQPPNPTRTWTNRRRHRAGRGRVRERLRLSAGSGGGPGLDRHSRVRVNPLRPAPPALPHRLSAGLAP